MSVRANINKFLKIRNLFRKNGRNRQQNDKSSRSPNGQISRRAFFRKSIELATASPLATTAAASAFPSVAMAVKAGQTVVMVRNLATPSDIESHSDHEIIWGVREKGQDHRYLPRKSYDVLRGRARPRRLSNSEVDQISYAKTRNHPWSLIETDHGLVNVLEAGIPMGVNTRYVWVGTPCQIWPLIEPIRNWVKQNYHVIAIEPIGYGWSTHFPYHDFTQPAMVDFRRMMYALLGYENVTDIDYSWAPMDSSHSFLTLDPNELPVNRRIWLNPFDNTFLNERQYLMGIERFLVGNRWGGAAALRLSANMPKLGVRDTNQKQFGDELPPAIKEHYAREFPRPWLKDCIVYETTDPSGIPLGEQTTSAYWQSWYRYLVMVRNTERIYAWAQGLYDQMHETQLPETHLIGFNRDQIIRGKKHLDPVSFQNALYDEVQKRVGKERSSLTILAGGHRGIMTSRELDGILSKIDPLNS